jgi:cytochrome P450
METSQSVERAPGPRALPVIGGMLQLRGDPLARIRALRAQHGGFVRLGPLGGRDVFLVTDPEAVRHALLDNYKNYKKGLPAQRLRPALGQGSLLLEGDVWRKRRRLIQPAFHHKKIATLAGAFVDGADAMIERWKPRIDAGAAIDAREEMLQLTMRLTLRNMFNADLSEVRPLVDAWQHIYDELSRNRMRLVRLPSWVPSSSRDASEQALRTVHRVLGELIRARTETDDGSVLAMLLRARDDEGGGSLAEDELRDEVMTIFIGGYETSSNALAFTLSLLAAHPEHAERWRGEVDAVLGDRAPTITDLAALPFTRAALDEALRRFPPSWMITREALTDDVVAGFPVKGGAQLLLSSYGVHHAPELWPAPDEYRPDRFLPDAPEAKDRPRFAYFPFGGGPRICLGDTYALTEMHLILARLAQKLTFEPALGLRIEPQAHVGLRPRHPLRIHARWR